jgi:hypothetical protein
MALTDADIALVRHQVEQAISSFAVQGFEKTGMDCLREAVRLLEGIREMARREPLTSRLAPALRDVQTRAAHLGQLVDSAAAFYRGWLGASPAAAEHYTAEGVWAAPARSISVGALLLEA